MPLVQLEVVKGRSSPEKRALFDAVHEALVDAFKIPDDDRVQRLTEFETDDFDAPSASLTIVSITMFPGRSAEAKRELYKGIVERFEGLGIPGPDVMIVLDERPLEDWGIRGGQAASDVDLGFDLDV
jgi:phenylpyruvate tautomerase PptA (4-oxalocrotonate tautomerase family)